MIAEKPYTVKPCANPNCNKKIRRHLCAGEHAFLNRKYCSRACANADHRHWNNGRKDELLKDEEIQEAKRPIARRRCRYCGKPATAWLAHNEELAVCDDCEARLYREEVNRRTQSVVSVRIGGVCY